MIYLPQSLQAWKSNTFSKTLQREVCSIDPALLPLQQGLRYSSMANGNNLSVSVLTIDDNNECIVIKAGLFYSGIIAGCNCADDPTPVDENNEYCEVLLCINKMTAETTAELISQD